MRKTAFSGFPEPQTGSRDVVSRKSRPAIENTLTVTNATLTIPELEGAVDRAIPAELVRTAYRADIDGLRGIAVLCVVIYHAIPLPLHGGFVGVDVFFVISGFLISTIIFGSLERQTFSFIDFYVRRIKRIFPALLTVLVAALAFGWLFLLADEYEALGKSTVAGSAFIANYVFLDDNAYFAGTSIFKPMLHLWSLGVEEQYYILWPLIVWAFWKARVNILAMTLGIAAVSFLWNLMTYRSDPIGAFYLPQARFWELMAGSALAYASLNGQPRPMGPGRRASPSAWIDALIPRASRLALQSAAGLALIVYAAFNADPQRFPGFWATEPVLGAVLLISAGPQALINRRLLASRALVWVGGISFPLYLWHWPILSLSRIVAVGVVSLPERLLAVGAAFVLAWATTRYVERPLRFSRGRASAAALAAIMALVSALGATTVATNGFDGWGYRTPDRSALTAYYENAGPDWNYLNREGIGWKYRADCGFNTPFFAKARPSDLPRDAIDPSCVMRDPTKKHVVFIWGDSHAQMLYWGLRQTLPDDWQIMIVASSSCPPDPSVVADSATQVCQRSNFFALQTISAVKPDVVIAARADGANYAAMLRLADGLRERGARHVLLPGPAPQWDAKLPKIVLRRLWPNTPLRTFVGLNAATVRENERLQAAFAKSGVPGFVDIFKLFCDEAGCLTRVGEDRIADLTDFDFGHLTPAGSIYLAKHLLTRAVIDASEAGD